MSKRCPGLGCRGGGDKFNFGSVEFKVSMEFPD